jgi:transcription-repair coupling factor (superfamily II helicase)
MEAPRPMDRLICGDVGYGKTEIAIRGAFKAVMDGYQVAVLVPTTVLAQQHYNTFRERLASLPCRVEMLSRFLNDREARSVLAGLAEGSVDIIIGRTGCCRRTCSSRTSACSSSTRSSASASATKSGSSRCVRRSTC